MEQFKQKLFILIVVMWIIFPDLIPGPIDDILLAVLAISTGMEAE